MELAASRLIASETTFPFATPLIAYDPIGLTAGQGLPVSGGYLAAADQSYAGWQKDNNIPLTALL